MPESYREPEHHKGIERREEAGRQKGYYKASKIMDLQGRVIGYQGLCGYRFFTPDGHCRELCKKANRKLCPFSGHGDVGV